MGWLGTCRVAFISDIYIIISFQYSDDFILSARSGEMYLDNRYFLFVNKHHVETWIWNCHIGVVTIAYTRDMFHNIILKNGNWLHVSSMVVQVSTVCRHINFEVNWVLKCEVDVLHIGISMS